MNNIFTNLKVLALVIVAIFALSPQTTQAQVDAPMNISPGLEFALFTNGGDIGIGATVRYQYNLNEQMGLTAKTGYIAITRVDQGSGGVIPFMVGFKYYFIENLYAMGELGTQTFRYKYDDSFFSASTSATRFSFAPGIGYVIPLGSVGLDLGAHFNVVTNSAHYLNIRAGVNIPIGG